jgi:hypothetical protein
LEELGQVFASHNAGAFFLALELVQAHRNLLTNVLLTDSCDVVLQQDPFRQIGQRLLSGLEENN